MSHLVFFACLFALPLLAKDAAIPASDFQREVFRDNFEVKVLGKRWRQYKASSFVKDGVLIGVEEKDGGHAAVHSVVLDSFSDVELQLDLRFAGSWATNLTFNEGGFKGSHAGHICRVVLSKSKVILRDGKTGVFKNEIYEMRKAGKADAATKALLKTKEASFPVKLKEDTWYAVTIRIKGDLIQLLIDGKQLGSFRSEGIAHATKNKIALVTPKQEMHYDNVVIKVP